MPSMLLVVTLIAQLVIRCAFQMYLNMQLLLLKILVSLRFPSGTSLYLGLSDLCHTKAVSLSLTLAGTVALVNTYMFSL